MVALPEYSQEEKILLGRIFPTSVFVKLKQTFAHFTIFTFPCFREEVKKIIAESFAEQQEALKAIIVSDLQAIIISDLQKAGVVIPPTEKVFGSRLCESSFRRFQSEVPPTEEAVTETAEEEEVVGEAKPEGRKPSTSSTSSEAKAESSAEAAAEATKSTAPVPVKTGNAGAFLDSLK